MNSGASSSNFASAIRIRMPPENSANVADKVLLGKAEPEQHRGGAALGAVEVVVLELGQHLAEFLECGVVRRPRMLAREYLLDFLAPRSSACIRSSAASVSRSTELPAHLGRVLRKVADAGALRPGDSSRVERHHFRDHLQQRRFARAVEPDQADPSVVVHRPADAVENLAAPVGLGEVVETKHGEKVILSARFECRK